MSEKLNEREMDAALARYAAAEPRAGLEGRVLVNLRAERGRRVAARRWLWPAVAGFALATAIIAAFVWNSRVVAPVPIAQVNPHAAGEMQKAHVSSERSIAPEPAATAQAVKRTATAPVHYGTAASAQAPKLDQFPSPQPLSEQERLLMRYANADPDAILFAQARADELKKEIEDRGAE